MPTQNVQIRLTVPASRVDEPSFRTVGTDISGVNTKTS